MLMRRPEEKTRICVSDKLALVFGMERDKRKGLRLAPASYSTQYNFDGKGKDKKASNPSKFNCCGMDRAEGKVEA